MRGLTLASLLILGFVSIVPASSAGEARDVRERHVLTAPAHAALQVRHAPAVQRLAEGAVLERYKLNAQYRGGVTKGFSDIGSGQAVFTPETGGRFAVKLDGTVENPENKEVYQFWLDMEFSCPQGGGTIRVLRNGSRYSSRAVEYRERVEKVVPFLYLVKFSPLPRPGEEPTRSYRFGGSDYVLRYVPTERHVEASLYEGDALVGKYFLQRSEKLPLSFEKFRVPTEGNVVLSFIRLD